MEADTPKVSIIIPHYNQVKYLKRLLPSVASQTFQDYEVIIIDDFSPDRSAVGQIRELIKGYPKMRLVENAENLRFVKTCNKGIELAKGDYVCLLNQDTEVKSSFVQRNIEIMDADSLIGGLSCIIVDKDGKNWFTGGRFDRGRPVNLVDDFEGIRTVDFVAGTACFYRKEIFDRIGLFEKDFVMYHEDIEFGLRMKAKTSYKACMFAEKLVVHYITASMPRGDFYYYANRNHMILVRRYSRKYISREILFLSVRTLWQIANLLLLSVSKRDLKIVRGSWYAIKGTLDGLLQKQSN
ncbi:MAG TPA: glycosyltransferase family 2 protein [Dehalococcoidia bacterium]|nr:glycosyltransferase family 2 protein [Dehalococcoidia bacterium]